MIKETLDLPSGLFLRNLEWWAKFVVKAWIKVVPAESSICNDRISLPGVAGCLGGGGGGAL